MKIYLVLTSLFILFFLDIDAQFLINPSLDGEDSNKKPYNWYTCCHELSYQFEETPFGETFGPDDFTRINNWNDPDMIVEQIDTAFNINISKIDGDNMSLLRTRGIYYSSVGKRRSYEHMSSKLLSPLQKGHCYLLSINLCHIPYCSEIGDSVDPFISYPLRFQAWGANDSCCMEEKLVDSEPITNETFEEYNFPFQVKENNYSYIYFRVYWDNSIKDYYYNGIMFLDKANLIEPGDVILLEEDTLYFRFEPPLELTAPSGEYYFWDSEEFLSSTGTQIATLTKYDSSVSVMAACDDECLVQPYKILFSCDSLYPDNVLDTQTVYYKRDITNNLVAVKGIEYAWDSTPTLSSYSIQNPVIKEYNEHFKVTLVNEYGCDFEQHFNVIFDCDSFYFRKVYNHKLVTTAFGETIDFDFAWDGISAQWSPEKYLSCPDCLYPVATPTTDTIFKATITDEYNCLHTELFPVDVLFGVPNVITPGAGRHGDGKNDVFCIPDIPEGSSIQIFSKTGIKVFEANPYNENNWWDGYDMNGKPVPSGTYWYILKLGNKSKPQKGFVMVIR